MSHIKKTATLSGAVGLAFASVMSSAAWAQGAPGAAARADADQLQEVIITAERRATNVQSTPISIQAVSGEQLAEQQLNTIMDLQKSTPNFQVNTTGLYNSINIRGIGNTAITPSITPGVAVFHDGLLAPETIGISEPFYDIRDNEILRGPQGTLVGESSTGGAVEINSQNPNFNGTNGYVEGVFGDFTDTKIDGAVNLQMSDTFAARIAFNSERRGSFYRNIGSQILPPTSKPLTDPGETQDRNFRVGLLWRPSDSFQALFKAEFNYSDPGGTASEPNQTPFAAAAGQACPNLADVGTCYSTYYHTSTHVPFLLNYNRTDTFDKQVNNRYLLDLNYTLSSGVVFRSLSGFQHNDTRLIEDNDFSSADAAFLAEDIGPNNNYYSEELTLSSATSSKFTWIVGASWFYRHTPVYLLGNSYSFFPTNLYPPGQPQMNVTIPGPGSPSNIGATQRTEGIFGNIAWQLTDTLQLSIGARGNWDQNFGRGNFALTLVCPAVGCPPFATVPSGSNWGTFPAVIPNNSDYKDNAPTGKVGLNWAPTDGQFFYVFAARGYKAGGAQPGNANFDPEHVNDFELGWKGKLLDGHLLTQLGGFWMAYQDMQFTKYNTATGRGGAVVNIGSSTIKGIEFSAQGRFGHFGADVSLAYTDSKLGSINGIAQDYRLPPSAANSGQCVVVGGACSGVGFNYNPYLVNLTGEQNPYSPKFSATASVDYSIPMGEATLRPRVGVSHTDQQYTALFQTDNYFLLPARNLWDVSVSYDKGPWTVQAFCNNFTNVTYITGKNAQNEFYGAPRLGGVRINRTF
jgi:iron complex outermembrane receptor protein